MQEPQKKTPHSEFDRAQVFTRVRAARDTEMAEDYVELIADLIAVKGEARMTDIAKAMGLNHATVNKTIQRLNKEGYVLNEPYRSLFLTDKGKRLAVFCKQRHELVYNFLLCLGVNKKTAEHDSEGMEHHISPETLRSMERLVTLAKKSPTIAELVRTQRLPKVIS